MNNGNNNTQVINLREKGDEENNPEWDGIEKGKKHANKFFEGLM